MMKIPRAFDHAILPVESLVAARTRHEALGFTVAPEAKHPFGTENCCIFFEDGTYLEPLAINQREHCERAALRGNQFTMRDQTFRFRNGDNGFSAIALKSDDADADHKQFRDEGISAGRKLKFGRTFVTPDGEKKKASFKLSFAADLRAPDFFGFTVQRLQMPDAGSSVLASHANGVTGIREVILSESNPTDFQYFLQEFSGQRETEAHSFGMEIKLGDLTLNVMTPEALRAYFGVETSGSGRGLRLEGIVFAGGKLENMRQHGRYKIADRAPGQGAFYASMDDL
ncbi:MAG: VOC family protein [Pseudomonadota bacterium]